MPTITYTGETLTPAQEEIHDLDLTLANTYDIYRGVAFGRSQGKLSRFIDFDPFAHLHTLSDQMPDRQLEVLEGGCGVGSALHQLKNGMVQGYSPEKTYEGLGDKIRTSGVTLTPEHAIVAIDQGTDEVFVGPIDRCPIAEDSFDFIYDFCGAAYYDPDAALSVYGRVLKPGGLAFVRLFEAQSEHAGGIGEITKRNGLRAIQSAGTCAVRDVLLEPTTAI
jgi:SAM-dependent methyltransferase